MPLNARRHDVHPTVRVDDDFPSGQAGVAHRTTNHETAGRINVIFGVGIEQVGRQGGLDHQLQDVSAKLFGRNVLGMLGGDNHCVDPDRIHILVVFHRHLALAIRPEIGKPSAFAHFRQFAAEFVCQRDRSRHQIFVLVGGIAEHHALVARSAGVHAHGDVAGLLIDTGDDGEVLESNPYSALS